MSHEKREFSLKAKLPEGFTEAGLQKILPESHNSRIKLRQSETAGIISKIILAFNRNINRIKPLLTLKAKEVIFPRRRTDG